MSAAASRTEGTTASFAKELVRRAVLAAALADEPPADDHLGIALDELLSDAQRLTRSLLGVGSGDPAQDRDGEPIERPTRLPAPAGAHGLGARLLPGRRDHPLRLTAGSATRHTGSAPRSLLPLDGQQCRGRQPAKARTGRPGTATRTRKSAPASRLGVVEVLAGRRDVEVAQVVAAERARRGEAHRQRRPRRAPRPPGSSSGRGPRR